MKLAEQTEILLSAEELKEAFKEYLTIKGYSKSTIEGMVLTSERFRLWTENENIPAENITYNDVIAYIQSLKQQNIKQKTQNTYIASIKRYIDHLVEQGILKTNPAEHLKLQSTNQRNLYQVFNLEDLENLYYQYPCNHLREMQQLAEKQNKVIVGLLVWQGVRTEDLCRLTITNLKLREGKIFIPGGRKTEPRTLELKSHQVIEMMDFINETRKAIMQRTNAETEQLFIGLAGSPTIYAIMRSITNQLKKQQPKIKNTKQIRASVITLWLKQYNLRKVQYMAGHRYVSSTEKFKINDLEGLQEEVNKFHPIG